MWQVWPPSNSSGVVQGCPVLLWTLIRKLPVVLSTDSSYLHIFYPTGRTLLIAICDKLPFRSLLTFLLHTGHLRYHAVMFIPDAVHRRLFLSCTWMQLYFHSCIRPYIHTYTHIPIPNCKSVYPQSLILSEHQRFCIFGCEAMREVDPAMEKLSGDSTTKSCARISGNRKIRNSTHRKKEIRYAEKRVDRSTAVCYYT